MLFTLKNTLSKKCKKYFSTRNACMYIWVKLLSYVAVVHENPNVSYTTNDVDVDLELLHVYNGWNFYKFAMNSEWKHPFLCSKLKVVLFECSYRFSFNCTDNSKWLSNSYFMTITWQKYSFRERLSLDPFKMTERSVIT